MSVNVLYKTSAKATGGRDGHDAHAVVGEQGVETTPCVQRVELVGPADTLPVDEDLRHGPPSPRAPDHLLAPTRLLPDIDLGERDALAVKQTFRPHAVGAERGGVDLDHGHVVGAPAPVPTSRRCKSVII